MNRTSGPTLVAVGGLALLLMLLAAACGPSTVGRSTGSPNGAAAPGALPETGGAASGTPAAGAPGGAQATGTVTATQAMSGTPAAGAPGGAQVTGTVTATQGMSGTQGAGATASATPGSTHQRVEVVLKDYTIEMATTLPSGTTVFRITDAGMVQHSFAILGPGFEDSLPVYLEPGQTQELTVTLTAGASYVVYCPVDSHRRLGMERSLTVTVSQP